MQPRLHTIFCCFCIHAALLQVIERQVIERQVIERQVIEGQGIGGAGRVDTLLRMACFARYEVEPVDLF